MPFPNMPLVMIPKRIFPANIVPSASTLQLSLPTANLTQIFVHLTVAAAALTGFIIAARPTPNIVTAVTLYSTSADFTTPQGLMIGTSGDLSVLGTGVGWFLMDVRALYSIDLFATSGGTATLAIEVGGQ